jgi:Flp pilus assembly protein CpaB
VTYNVRNIAIALIMAIAAAAVVLVYTTSFRQSVTRGQKRVDVMVATRDIPAGTPATEAAAAMQLSSVLVDDKSPGAIATTAGLDGKIATQTVFAGQQVVAASFGTSTTQAASLQLEKTERAVRVNVDTASGVLGQVRAGDYVDVFVTIKIKDTGTIAPGGAVDASPLNGGNDRYFTRRLLTKVRVLEVPELSKEKSGGLAKDANADKMLVMLAVSQADATKLVFTQTNPDAANLWFVVRPPESQAQDMPLTLETIESMIADGESPEELKKKFDEARLLVSQGAAG